jgi:hypothetical protein
MGKPMHGILSTTAVEILELLLFFDDKLPDRLLIFTDTNISKLRTEVYYCRLFLLRNVFRSSKQKILYFNHMKTQV